MSFRPVNHKPKPEPEPEPKVAQRRKATIRFTDQQWDQLHAYCFHKRTTVQAVIIAALADKLERFDV
jgi:hypothetical protein